MEEDKKEEEKEEEEEKERRVLGILRRRIPPCRTIVSLLWLPMERAVYGLVPGVVD